MVNSIQAIRGMNDILPNESFLWQFAENNIKQVLTQYSYEEIRLPLLEKTELFKRSIGEETDIVEKEMYTFLDRNNESLTLRPEGTAGCVRAGIEHSLFYHQIQRLWYHGPFFRYERPQRGRYRQFHQVGAEVFGLADPEIDAELIILSFDIYRKLELSSHITLELNSLGSPQSRELYRETLLKFLTANKECLDEDSQKRLMTNPLRILDSKNPTMQDLIKAAPKLTDHLDEESALHFEKLQHYLTEASVPFQINPCLVRGLDYYTKTVFEWVTRELGAQGTVCAGGRYDGLVEQLGGKPTPALGFAIGLERTVLLLQQTQTEIKKNTPDIYLMTDSQQTYAKALEIARELRSANQIVLQHVGEGSIKNQFKKADKSGARYAFILGEQEFQQQTITIKSLRENTPQVTLPQDSIPDFLKKS